MSDIGSFFNENTIFYDSKVPPSSVEFVASGKKVNAGEKVGPVFGLNQVILYRFFSGIPPPPEPVNFVAESFSDWAPGETVIVTGPFGDDGKRILELKGTVTNQVAIFQEKVDN